MKTYVITLSEYFPVKHKRVGEKTNFKKKFLNGEKTHTIRMNYPLWEKRIKEVQKGRAVLSIRQWTGKPYRSKQIEIATLTAKNGIGVQKLIFVGNDIMLPVVEYGGNKFRSMDRYRLASNDGLSFKNWVDWFRGYDLSKTMAIIHFTKFRY
jgi:hypothetical protein